MSRRILYLSLDGMAEALGASQVLEYLEDLAKENEIMLFSFEKKQDAQKLVEIKRRLENKKITWYSHAYSNRFFLISTGWILLLAFIRLNLLNYIFRPHIIHARSFVPALLGWVLAKLWRARLIFDIRGFAMDEKVDSGRFKKPSLIYNGLHAVEKFLYRHCDHLITLTHVSKQILCTEYALPANKVSVIPTCASRKLFYPLTTMMRQQLRQKLGFSLTQKLLLHTGSVSAWYDFDKEVALFAYLYAQDQSYHFIVLNKGAHAFIRAAFQRYRLPNSAYTLSVVCIEEVVQWVNIVDAALFFIKPSYAKQASLPTKFAEMVACHVPSITNEGVGDMDFYLKTYPVGMTINLNDFHQKIAYYAEKVRAFLTQPIEHEAYEQLFLERFDKALAVAHYAEIYKALQ
jgi:hypothetical protein